MDIEGLGSALIEQLVDNKLINDFADLYYLKKDELIKLERMGDKSSENIIKAIEDSKNRPLSSLIYALGIRYVGDYASKLIARKINSIYNLQNMTLEELVDVHGIGLKTAESILLFFRKNENMQIIERLQNAGVVLTSKKEETAKENTLKGIQFVLTGTLENFNREEAKNLIEQLGGRVTGNVTKKTDYLVLGKEPGQKYQKAKEMKIKIINEEEFVKMLGK